jgi:xylulokinase
MLAMVADGTYPNVKAVCEELVHVVDTVEPERSLVALYEVRYQQYRKLYPALKSVFSELL